MTDDYERSFPLRLRDSYVPLSCLGQGADHAVYRAIHLRDQQAVVLKIWRVDSTHFPSDYQHEQTILQRFDHRHIGQVLGHERDGGLTWLVLADHGLDAMSIVETHGPLPWPLAILCAHQIALALHEVHRKGFLHRDLSPANIVLSSDLAHATLIDFGCATPIVSRLGQAEFPREFCGTLAYGAPEQLGHTHAPCDERSDLYGLGAALYFLLTGHPPFVRAEHSEVVYSHLAVPAPSVVPLCPDAPPVVDRIVGQLLAKSPDQRYQSALGLARDLWDCWQASAANDGKSWPHLRPTARLGRLTANSLAFARHTQRDQLDAQWLAVRHGQPRLITQCTGDGSTRDPLIAEFVERLQAVDVRCVTVHAERIGEARPYAVLLRALNLAITGLTVHDVSIRAALAAKLRSRLGARLGLAVDFVPALADIVTQWPAILPVPEQEAEERLLSTFCDLVACLLRPGDPLCLHFADFQWADHASQRALLALAQGSQGDIGPLLLIVSCQLVDALDSPADAAILDDLAALGKAAGHRGIHLHHDLLQAEEVADALALVLDRAPDDHDLLALCTLACEHTGGRATSLSQWFDHVAREDLLAFHIDRDHPNFGRWEWDLEHIRRQVRPRAVDQRVLAELAEFSPELRWVIDTIACLGMRPSLAELEALLACSREVLMQALHQGRSIGLFCPALANAHPLEDSVPACDVCFEFVNEGLRDGVLTLLAQPRRNSLYRHIGEFLEQREGERALASDTCFRAAQYLNALPLDELDPDRRRRLAQLNLQAGRRARQQSANRDANVYFAYGLRLLGETPSTADDELWFTLRQEASQSAIFCGELERAAQLAKSAVDHCTHEDQATPFHRLRLLSHTLRGDYTTTLALAQQILPRLGVDLPLGPWEEPCRAAFARIEALIVAQPLAEFAHSPPMVDAKAHLAMEVLISLASAGRFTDKYLFYLASALQVELSLRFGHNAHAPHAFALYALAQIALFGDPKRAKVFAQVALDTVVYFSGPVEECQTLFILAKRVLGWIRPFAEVRELALRGRRLGLEHGDHQHAGYMWMSEVYTAVIVGTPLADLEDEAIRAHAFASGVGHQMSVQVISGVALFLRWMQDPTLIEPRCAWIRESEYVGILPGMAGGFAGAHYKILRAMGCFALGDYHAAWQWLDSAEPSLGLIGGTYGVPQFHYYRGLLAALLLRLPETDDARHHVPMQALQSRFAAALAYLADISSWCPDNFEHLYLGLKAQDAILRGEATTAIAAFEQVITSLSSRDDFRHDRAMVRELYARHLATLGWLQAAQAQENLALADFRALGWRRKAALHPEPLVRAGLPRQNRLLTNKHGSTALAMAIDVGPLIKAAQTLSQTMVPDEIDALFVQLAVEHAGATRGELYLVHNQQHQPSWRCLARFGGTPELPPTSGTILHQHAPPQVLDFVTRSGRELVVTNAFADPRFADTHLGKTGREVLSMVCLPIRLHAAVNTLLYLENDGLQGVFSEDRLEILRMLATQAVICRENANLYQSMVELNAGLEARVFERTRELQEAQSEVVARAHQAGMAELAADVLHNVGNLLNNLCVSTYSLRELNAQTRLGRLDRVARALHVAAADPLAFVQSEKASQVLEFVANLLQILAHDSVRLRQETERLEATTMTMRDVIAAQQNLASGAKLVENIDLAAMVGDFLRIHSPGLDLHGIAVRQAVASGWLVQANRSKLLHVLINLVKNAKESLQQARHCAPTIVITSEVRNQAPCLIVRDNGPGLSADALTRIFAHGYTTKRHGKGFGLHSCANYMTEMGGSMSAENHPDGGACFVLVFKSAVVRDHDQAA